MQLDSCTTSGATAHMYSITMCVALLGQHTDLYWALNNYGYMYASYWATYPRHVRGSVQPVYITHGSLLVALRAQLSLHSVIEGILMQSYVACQTAAKGGRSD